jgi:hypothetical protein
MKLPNFFTYIDFCHSTPPGLTATNTAFGTVVSNTGLATATGSGSVGSSAASTPSNSAALPVRFNMNAGVVASVILSVFAGTAVVGL